MGFTGFRVFLFLVFVNTQQPVKKNSNHLTFSGFAKTCETYLKALKTIRPHATIVHSNIHSFVLLLAKFLTFCQQVFRRRTFKIILFIARTYWWNFNKNKFAGRWERVFFFPLKCKYCKLFHFRELFGKGSAFGRWTLHINLIVSSKLKAFCFFLAIE